MWKVWKGREKNKKNKYLEKEKGYLDEIYKIKNKKNFSQFCKGCHLVKNKKIDKIDS